MRKINITDFQIAVRTTSRDINRQIALNLIRAHQPVSRADLARKMNIGRGVITVLVKELIKDNLIFEGEIGKAPKGRKPTLLYIKSDNRFIVAVDIRVSKTYLMLTDFAANKISLDIFETSSNPDELIGKLVTIINSLLKAQTGSNICEGIGIVVPGIIEYKTGLVLRAPTLGWENVEIRKQLAKETGLPVKIENAPKACALAQIWLGQSNNSTPHNFVYVSVSDGVGVGIVLGGELVRGRNDIAGEFGHIQIETEGNLCGCGKKGCWETYISNPATVARFVGTENAGELTVTDVIAKARAGDDKAVLTLKETGKYLGFGISKIINTINPEQIYLGGEVTMAWDLIQESVFDSIAKNVLIEAAAQTPIRIAPTIEYPRLRGAAALIVAPTFAALKVA